MTDDKHFKIRVGTITPDKPLTFDLYVQVNNKYIHYLKEGEVLATEKLNKLKSADQFFVLNEQRKAFKDFIFSAMNDATVSVRNKAQILRDTSLALVEEIYSKHNVGEALQDSKEVIEHFVSLMDHSPDNVAHLVELSSHDFYTFNHSLDVSVYSMGIGNMLKLSEEEMVELGQGALLHDIGKKWVAAEIICKNGALDDSEWAQMQKHPAYGLKILNEYDVSDAVRACCFEHHESFLGNGYPQGLDGPSIHPMARIVAIADTFDALTTQRSYNTPMTPNDAVEFMITKIKGKYDPEILQAMKAVLAN